MTRDEMRQIKENKKAMEIIIKNDSKLFGYKTSMGYVYKFIDEFVFEILIIVNKNISGDIRAKPIILDKIFWEIFDMNDEVKNKPKSFHINGAFVANAATINTFEFEYSKSEEAKNKFKNILETSNDIIENFRKNVFDINSFQEYIKNNPNQYLNDIFIDIINKKYKESLKKINQCIKEYKTGGFRVNCKSIIEYAKDYCEKNME